MEMYLQVQDLEYSQQAYQQIYLCFYGIIMIYTSIYIWYMGYIVETDISKVTNGMKSILKAKDNVVLNNLPILRNDEIGELVR